MKYKIGEGSLYVYKLPCILRGMRTICAAAGGGEGLEAAYVCNLPWILPDMRTIYIYAAVGGRPDLIKVLRARTSPNYTTDVHKNLNGKLIFYPFSLPSSRIL